MIRNDLSLCCSSRQSRLLESVPPMSVMEGPRIPCNPMNVEQTVPYAKIWYSHRPLRPTASATHPPRQKRSDSHGFLTTRHRKARPAFRSYRAGLSSKTDSDTLPYDSQLVHREIRYAAGSGSNRSYMQLPIAENAIVRARRNCEPPFMKGGPS